MHTFDRLDLRAAVIATAILVASAAGSACSALDAYSQRAARSAGACQGGWPTEDGPMAYPGDPEWPFEHGLCKPGASARSDVATARN